jgi:hypothetical protein
MNADDTIDVDGENVFRIETILDRGFFGVGPAFRLGRLQPSILGRSSLAPH